MHRRRKNSSLHDVVKRERSIGQWESAEDGFCCVIGPVVERDVCVFVLDRKSVV